MKKMFSALALVTMVGASGFAVSPAQEAPDGKALYDKKCAMCHGKDGVAKKMAAGSVNLNDPEWQKVTELVTIIGQINEGKGKMKPYKDKFSPAEVEAIARYTKTLP